MIRQFLQYQQNRVVNPRCLALAILLTIGGCGTQVLPVEQCSPAKQATHLANCHKALDAACAADENLCAPPGLCADVVEDMCPSGR